MAGRNYKERLELDIIKNPLDYDVAVKASHETFPRNELTSYLFYEAFGYEKKRESARKSLIKNYNFDPEDPGQFRKLLYIVNSTTPPLERDPLIEFLLLSKKAPKKKKDAAKKKLELSVQSAMMI